MQTAQTGRAARRTRAAQLGRRALLLAGVALVVALAFAGSGPDAVGGAAVAGNPEGGEGLIPAVTLMPPGAHPAGPPAPVDRTREEAEAASQGCLSCHLGTEPMHPTGAVRLACTDCHGGDASAVAPAGPGPGDPAYEQVKVRAHIAPRFPEAWSGPDGRRSAANPERTYSLLARESPEFVRFINPGDLRVAQQACGPCHQEQVNAVLKSPMTTTAIFWAAAGYANGIVAPKFALLGETYSPEGRAQSIQPLSPLTLHERMSGALEQLLPLPRWEITQPGEYFRAFERGGITQPSAVPDIGNPLPFEEPGKPDIRLSNRGLGTGLRISPALINLQKTRLNDPHLSYLGTNDHPGDFRSSGCAACHVVYANDREVRHSGPWAADGHLGLTASSDPTIPWDESGHPIRHQLTRAVPTSQCMVCHMHQPNAFLNTYLGYQMWDYETDGELLWPEEQRYPTPQEARASLEHNPEGAAVRGLWSDRDFLANVRDLNDQAQHTQFADYHGHGWVFRAVYKRDRKGNLLDADGEVVDFTDPERFDKSVHLMDIHLERGMHCADCHFSQDVHGDGLIHGEYGNAIEIECQDCHGGVDEYADLFTSGPASPVGLDGERGNDMRLGTTSFGERRFQWRRNASGNRELVQRSMLDENLEWVVPQTRDTVDPGHPGYNERSAWAKTVRRDGASWGLAGQGGAGNEGAEHPPLDSTLAYAHGEASMTCYSCHSSWMTSCFGCHLPQEANVKSEMLRYEGAETRNYASYNPQVIRTDIFMLGKNGVVKGGKIAPVRSSSALVLSSTNANRQRFYIQQPPISTPGYASQAFNPHAPHTVRTRETKACSDCHLSAAGDNNAWMAQTLTQGTGFVNFIGRFAWVALGEEGIEAVAVTEWDEPQAVIGSNLHRLAYPDDYAEHVDHDRKLEVAHHHHGGAGRHKDVRSIQLRGEYLFTAKGPAGFEVFDVANVDNKDFSERIVTAPFSALGQRTFVRTRYATAVALPTNMPVAPYRDPNPHPANLEQPMHPVYRYAFVSDRYEGLILVEVDTLTDREPTNNFFRETQPAVCRRDGRVLPCPEDEATEGARPGILRFNPGDELAGSENLTVAGNHVYLVGSYGLKVVDVSTPLVPRLVAHLPEIRQPTAVAVQFRYAFVTGAEGLTVVDITRPHQPRIAARLPETGPLHNLYLARTYAYLAAGKRGLVIVDIERPEVPRVDRVFNAEGRLNDTHDVKVGATNASLFAYVADGHNGLAVLQLTSPQTVPGYLGFSPRPEPRLIAHYPVHGEAKALSRGLDRDRAVDESGNQVSIFNRIGARPFNLREMQRLYLRAGEVYTVTDDPPARRSAAQRPPPPPALSRTDPAAVPSNRKDEP